MPVATTALSRLSAFRTLLKIDPHHSNHTHTMHPTSVQLLFLLDQIDRPFAAPDRGIRLQKLAQFALRCFAWLHGCNILSSDEASHRWDHGACFVNARTRFNDFASHKEPRLNVSLDAFDHDVQDVCRGVVVALKDITTEELVEWHHTDRFWLETERNEIIQTSAVVEHYSRTKDLMIDLISDCIRSNVPLNASQRDRLRELVEKMKGVLSFAMCVPSPPA